MSLLIYALGWNVLAAPQARYTVTQEAASGAGFPQVVVMRDLIAGVEAAVAPSEGGELTSLRVRFRGAWVELLYRARDYGPGPGFRGKAPFLWPAVGGQYPVGTTPAGSCEDGTYMLGERIYPMPATDLREPSDGRRVGVPPAIGERG